MSYYLVPVRMALTIQNDNNCQWGWREKGTLYTVGNGNWCSHLGKQYGDSPKKWKIELPNDPAILFLGIYLKKTKTLIRTDIYTRKFIAALFTMAKIWIQDKFPSIDEWIKKMCCVQSHTHTHTHRMEYYSAIRKERNLATRDNMTGPRVYYA